MIGIVSKEGFLGHLYYGKKLENVTGAMSLSRVNEPPYTPDTNDRDRGSFMDTFPFEYASTNVGDFRESALVVRDGNGHSAVNLKYESHSIEEGKNGLKGLPATFGEQGSVNTLKILCTDPETGLKAELSYSVFEDVDVITRNVKVVNETGDRVWIDKIMSMCLDMEGKSYDTLTLHGSWARERQEDRKTLGFGRFSIASLRGESSHQEQPFLALLEEGANDVAGEVYGFHFVYSGDFIAQVQKSQFGQIRVLMGIHPEYFCWELAPGEEFQTPEVVMVFSDAGVGKMTRNLHFLYRNHLIRNPWLHKERPILINNWEATYFDFDAEKLLQIAREGAKLGIEMLVLDDGWFGNRYDDNRALGDWIVNTKKLPGGLRKLTDELAKIGMKFGLWFEPEMISADSDLYRQHPDWAIQIPGRIPGRSRNQLVLDISRKEVRDYIMEQMFRVMDSAEIDYVKWDMNRPLTDLASAVLPGERQGELSHRYVLAMYEMQERLIQRYPALLLENCSGGGGRFDPGMLYYSPQIWCSDNTDAIERLKIQEGTALLYPLGCMGAHISACPNHIMGRNTPFETRAITALCGTFGYELDITRLSDEERHQIPTQIHIYHAFQELIREGIYYRNASYTKNHQYDCFQVNNKEATTVLIFFTQVLAEANMHSRFVKLQGLNTGKRYRIREVNLQKGDFMKDVENIVLKNTVSENMISEKMISENIVSGDILMNVGIQIMRLNGDFQARLYLLEQMDEG